MLAKQIRDLCGRNREKIRAILFIFFLMYSCLMLWEVFIGPYRSYNGIRRYNLYPFKTITEFLLNSTKYDFKVIFINLIANIITFMPLGFFISILFKRFHKFIILIVFCVFIIMCLEMGQFILNVGVLDIDDIILNTLGCALGFMLSKVAKKFCGLN